MLPTTATYQTEIWKIGQAKHTIAKDELAVEEPLEIRIAPYQQPPQSISITMRTPGHDTCLAIGFLYTEGIITGYQHIRKIQQIGPNIIQASLSPEADVQPERLKRHFYTTSSCGVCGKASIEAIYATHMPILPPPRPFTPAEIIHKIPACLRQQQAIFQHTGGIHAAALFDANGQITLLREDVGRHNAVDKLLGAALQQGQYPLHDRLILVSGRASFELIQKSLVAGLPILAAVGAPSSLAVQLAESAGMTLIGFLRNERFNIYTHPQRIIL